MTTIRRQPATLLLLVFAMSAGAQDRTPPAATATAGTTRFSFEDVEPGKLPPDFASTETAGEGTPAVWRVEQVPGAPDGGRVLSVESKNQGTTFNMVLSKASYPADLQLSVRVRARTGEEDRGGGLVWRARDRDNYYIARWNPLEDNLRLYKVENGKRQMFASAEAKGDPAVWHHLSVSMRGKTIAVAFDQHELIRHDDATFAGAGKVGLWTKADASSSFDVVEIARPVDELVSVFVPKAPAIDGNADDETWQAAPPLEVVAERKVPPRLGEATQVQLRSVHTDTSICFLVRWRDDTGDDVAHKAWIWDASKGAYLEGPEREDMLTLAFEHTGPFDADMLSGVEAVWDVWQWRSTRTNPQGFAMDRTHRYSKQKPAGKAKEYKTKAGEATIWIARPEDAGDTVEKKVPAPQEHGADRVLQYLPGTPSGSAADVRAKGVWNDGWWTLELERRLDTGHPDDTRFEIARRYRCAVATHDRTGDMDKASGVIELSFRGK